MSLDSGLKRRKGETADACIARLLAFHTTNLEFYIRQRKKMADLQDKLDNALREA